MATKNRKRIWLLEIGALFLCGIGFAILLSIPHRHSEHSKFQPPAIPPASTNIVAVQAPPSVRIQVSQSSIASTVSISTVEAIPLSKTWPDGFLPTKIVHIPDPKQIPGGFLDVILHQGDDLEFDIDPSWALRSADTNWLLRADVAVDSGSGFQPHAEYIMNRITDLNSKDVFWDKTRILRMRLASGTSEAAFSFRVNKKPTENSSVLPQLFHDLTITETKLQSLPDSKVLANLTFHNTSTVNTVAVAMYDEGCTITPCNLKSSLMTSDGTAFSITTSEIFGINGLRTRPSLLTPIGPGQELKASFRFSPQSNVSDSFTSLTLRAEVVINEDYRYGEYAYYPETGRDVLPPYCKVIGVTFNIPITRPSN